MWFMKKEIYQVTCTFTTTEDINQGNTCTETEFFEICVLLEYILYIDFYINVQI